MTELNPLRHIPEANVFRKGDVFVLFGELFGRGYVNGLIDEARAAGMTIVGITVGRRDDSGAPALTADPGRDDGGAAPNAALAAEPGRVDGGTAPRDSALRQTRDAALIGVRSDATLSFVRSRSAERRSALCVEVRKDLLSSFEGGRPAGLLEASAAESVATSMARGIIHYLKHDRPEALANEAR